MRESNRGPCFCLAFSSSSDHQRNSITFMNILWLFPVAWQMISSASNRGRGMVEGSISGLTTRELRISYMSIHPIFIIVITEFELHKRSEVWNAFDKSTVRWVDREFEQGRANLFNVLIEVFVTEIFLPTLLHSKVLNRRSVEGRKEASRQCLVCAVFEDSSRLSNHSIHHRHHSYPW